MSYGPTNDMDFGAAQPFVPRTYQVGKTIYATGLFWQLLDSPRDPMSAARRLAAELRREMNVDLDIVVLRRDAGVLQAGFVAKSQGIPTNVYSMASILATQLERDAVALFRLASGEGLLFAVNQGAIMPGAEGIFEWDEAEYRFRQAVNDFPSETAKQIICPADMHFLDASEVLLDDLLRRAKHPSSAKLQALSRELALRQRAGWIFAGIMGVAGYFFYDWYTTQVAREKAFEAARVESERIAAAEQLSAQAAHPVQDLQRPWVSVPLAPEMAAACLRVMNALPISLDGWDFSSAECVAGEVRATYARWDLGTIDQASVFNAFYGLPPPALSTDGQSLVMVFPIGSIRPGGDSPLPSGDALRDRFLSLLQPLGTQYTFEEVQDVLAVPEALPGQEAPPPPPPPPWRTFNFTADAPHGIGEFSSLMALPGARLTKVQVSTDTSSSALTWRLEGVLYAIR